MWPILATFLVLSLTACGTSVKQIEIVSAPLERVPLDLPPVDVLKLDKVSWIIVTEDNVQSIWEDLQKKKFSIVIFGLTDRGYEDLSVNMAKLQKLVKQQKAVIAAYRRYYEDQNKAIDDQEKGVEDAKKKNINNQDKQAGNSIGTRLEGLFK